MSEKYLITIYEENEIIFDEVRVPEDLSMKQIEQLKLDPTVKVKIIEVGMEND